MYYEFPTAYFEIIESAASCIEDELMLKEEALRLLGLEKVENEIKDKLKDRMALLINPTKQINERIKGGIKNIMDHDNP